MAKRVYVAGTADTKGEELAFLADLLRGHELDVAVADLGTGAPSVAIDISSAEIAAHAPGGAASILGARDRGTAVAGMTEAFARFMASREDVAGVVGLGGGAGTAIVTAGMRALPLGVPKLMVSTLASGDVGPYLGVSDIVMAPSVTDIAGLNRLSRVILHNAAQAFAGMVRNPPSDAASKPAIGLTMFGVTTPCVTAIAEELRSRYDCMIFHATGTGGRAMEKLAASGMLEGLIDITTTEIPDLLFGGVLPAGEDRLDVVARTGLPYVGSVGACDMVNFWAPETVPERFAGRLFYRHNSNVTLMRTTAEECAAIGEWIGRKLNACKGPVRFLLPERGVSAIDVEGGPFFDPQADAALFGALERTIVQTGDRRLVRLPLHINDPAFAAAAVAAWAEVKRLMETI